MIQSQTKGGYQIREQGGIHFLTFTVVDWVDVFSRKDYRDIIIESIIFCQAKKGMNVYAYVIMSNHIHIMMHSLNRELSNLIRDFKKYTAQMILKRIMDGPESRSEWILKRFEFAARSHSSNKNYQFWQKNNHPEEVFSEPFMWSKINYIHMNPVRAGIVNRASEYVYSSASNYVSNDGLINMELPSVPIIDPLKSGYHLEIDQW
ncbi:REP-associated tyrosine transposase [Arcticibacterium luteifluviistationis]|uniref:Transposase n=1 Tax=Arcticibacterium luteifluviistationis TaxID=1784714 RepID=A0A2Z4G815_9BACT|nr:transposase [Arcticibacterium luteifluviistationis]AWV97297.1 transposase [Arcticibacterium luteifluviistationis]